MSQEGATSIQDLQNQPQTDAIQHPPVADVNALVSHLREMVEQGYTDEQIKELHPELGGLFADGTQSTQG